MHRQSAPSQRQQGACNGQCQFSRDDNLLFCVTHNRFIDPLKHEQLGECSLDKCGFVVEREGRKLICMISGRTFEFELCEEGSHKYKWCTGVDNENLNVEFEDREEGDKDEMDEDKLNEKGSVNRGVRSSAKRKKKAKCEEGEEEELGGGSRSEEEDTDDEIEESGGNKRSGEKKKRKKKKKKKVSDYASEAMGRKKSVLDNVRENMVSIVSKLVDNISVSVSVHDKEEMVNAACHAYSIMRLKNPADLHKFPLGSFAALFFLICTKESLAPSGTVKLGKVKFPANFINPSKWSAFLNEVSTRALLSKKQLILRDIIKKYPEIVKIRNYNPFVIPPQAVLWEDLTSCKI